MLKFRQGLAENLAYMQHVSFYKPAGCSCSSHSKAGAVTVSGAAGKLGYAVKQQRLWPQAHETYIAQWTCPAAHSRSRHRTAPAVCDARSGAECMLKRCVARLQGLLVTCCLLMAAASAADTGGQVLRLQAGSSSCSCMHGPMRSI